MTREISNGQTTGPLWTREQALTLAALISCLSIYGITISLFTPLLSLILEDRGVSTTVIGALAMAAPVGVVVGSFVIPRVMRQLEGRNLLAAGVIVEIALIYALMMTESLAAWFVIRFLGGLTGAVLFVVTETWMIEIAPELHRGRVMGLYNTTLALSFALGPLMLSITGVAGPTPFVAGMTLMALAGMPLLFAGRYRPSFVEESAFGVVSFLKVAPLLAIACFVVAFKDLATSSLMPVYGLRVGLDESAATLMLFFGAIGGALLQLPIGWAADYFDARKVLIACALVAFLGALVWPLVVGSKILLWITLFLWWGFFAGVYTVTMILAGQWFKGVELATAMAAFGVYWGIGAFAGPLIGGLSMDLWDPYGLAAVMVIVSGGFMIMSLRKGLYGPRSAPGE
tara:strand:+ start:280 stop:1479 length:1200 start_codon:yes stop_codon:yes gene_type:complete